MRRALASLVVVSLLWCAGVALLGVGAAVDYGAPFLALLWPLLAGRYPGEGVLTRAGRRARWCTSARTQTPTQACPPLSAGRLPRGGGLLASPFAGRAPPLSA